MATTLVPLDGSDLALQALQYAEHLGGADGRLLLLQVVPTSESVGNLFGLTDREGSAEAAAARGVAAAELAQVAERHGLASDRVETEVVQGDPSEQIVAVAQARGVAMIAMASRGRGAIGRAIFGSVADRVARTAKVPTLIVTPHDDASASATITRLVVPLDGSATAEEALPVALGLAGRLGIGIHLVRAVDPATTLPATPALESFSPTSAEISDQIYEQVEADARESLVRAAARCRERGVAATTSLLDGSPYFAIAGAVRAGDLLVMTSHGRGGVERWLLGSVAEKLVREGPVPVLLVPISGREHLVAGSGGAG